MLQKKRVLSFGTNFWGIDNIEGNCVRFETILFSSQPKKFQRM